MSNYIGSERNLLTSVARSLGATTNEIFERKQRPILISPRAEGEKYKAAIKWDLPVVTSDWLMKCLEQEEEVPLTSYLVGDSQWLIKETKDTTTHIGQSETTSVIPTTKKRKSPQYFTPLPTQNRFAILEVDSDDGVMDTKKIRLDVDHVNNKALDYPFDEERKACIEKILLKYKKL